LNINNNYVLLDGVASGDGPEVTVSVGGLHKVTVVGTFGGCNVSVSILGSDGTSFAPIVSPVSDSSSIDVEIPSGSVVKASVSGGTSPEIFADMRFVRN
jgi:hypothetical protein